MPRRSGLLSKLLGPDGTYKNYDLRLVGHSLGGSICALTGLRVRTNDVEFECLNLNDVGSLHYLNLKILEV